MKSINCERQGNFKFVFMFNREEGYDREEEDSECKIEGDYVPDV